MALWFMNAIINLPKYTFGLNLVINVVRLVRDHIKEAMHFNNMRYDDTDK